MSSALAMEEDRDEMRASTTTSITLLICKEELWGKLKVEKQENENTEIITVKAPGDASYVRQSSLRERRRDQTNKNE